jgi:hypothetical protein
MQQGNSTIELWLGRGAAGHGKVDLPELFGLLVCHPTGYTQQDKEGHTE